MEDQQETQDLRTRVILRAWKDTDFRQLVRENPRAAIESMGETVPEGMSFNVVEDVPGTYNLVLIEPPSGEPSTVERRELRAQGGASQGAHCTLTAECFCPDSITGACGLFC